MTWSGSREITLDGSGRVELELDMTKVPLTHISKVELFFANQAKIKGTLTGRVRTSPGDFSGQQVTVSTKAAYSYNPITHTGGADVDSNDDHIADNYLAFAGPAEEVTVWLSHDDMALVPIMTAADYTVSADTQPVLTILVDLNRMLRFYAGTGDFGVLPSDANTDGQKHAYFFCYTIFRYSSVAAFFGEPGRIQGYETVHTITEVGKNEPGDMIGQGGRGWMTLVFDAQGRFLSGMLTQNSENDLSINSGMIDSWEENNNVITFHYDRTDVWVEGFTVLSSPNSSWEATWHQPAISEPPNNVHGDRYGEVLFTLKFDTNLGL